MNINQIPLNDNIDSTFNIYDETYINYLNNISEVKEAKNHFLDTGMLSDFVRPVIRESWKRCMNNNFDPCNIIIPRLSNPEFKKICEDNRLLLEVSSKIINSICKLFNQISFTMLLTDSDCNILYINDSKYYTKGFNSGHLFTGANWQEKYVGTNSMSLALIYNKNITVHEAEHLYIECERAICSSAVIHDINGNPIGTITITHYREFNHNNLSDHKFISNMVYLAANLIEQYIVLDRNQKMLISVFKEVNDGILLLDDNLIITNANECFLNLTNATLDEIIGVDIQDLLKDFPKSLLIENENSLNHQINIRETTLHYKGNLLRVALHIYKILNFGKVDGVIVVCRSLKDIIKFSQKYTEKTPSFEFRNIITQNKDMINLLESMRQVSKLDCPILIEGESGTGKELCVQSIHNASNRKKHPFIAVNCAALPMELIESELFGYEKGSFTGALSSGKPGKFELAENGTLFLDEIGELPLNMQSKLLRVLDNYKVARIGGTIEKKLNIRIIAATNRNLRTEVEKKNFREDLYYRLNVMNFKLPSLKERKIDIPLLIQYFTDMLNRENPLNTKKFSDRAINILCAYDWPGNIRELQNIVYRAYYMCNYEIITEKNISDNILSYSQSEILASVKDTIQLDTYKNMERTILIEALNKCQGRAIIAAKELGIPKTTFYRKIKFYGIDLEKYK